MRLFLDGIPSAAIRANIPDNDRLHLYEHDRNYRDCLRPTYCQHSGRSLGRFPPLAILWRMQHGDLGSSQSGEYFVKIQLRGEY
jgi:hypothetical protein